MATLAEELAKLVQQAEPVCYFDEYGDEITSHERYVPVYRLRALLDRHSGRAGEGGAVAGSPSGGPVLPTAEGSVVKYMTSPSPLFSMVNQDGDWVGTDGAVLAPHLLLDIVGHDFTVELDTAEPH